METCKEFPDHEHPHHEACPGCGDTHRVLVGIPGRAMGGMWIASSQFRECRTCGKRLS